MTHSASSLVKLAVQNQRLCESHNIVEYASPRVRINGINTNFSEEINIPLIHDIYFIPEKE